jgi:HD-GYP domain-containing protein (c-di-GMP phosphodiesterase class II)
MIKTIEIADLKIGMYVILPFSWFKHPFLKGRFIVKTQADIDRIAETGHREVAIDTAKGLSFPNIDVISHKAESDAQKHRAPATWEPDKLIPEELRNALADSRMPKQRKAEVVYLSSLKMMQRLFEDPKVENIRAVKEEISRVVDVIISDDATARHMLTITTHDFYTYTHSVNVGVLGVMLSNLLFAESDGHDMHELGAGYFLHDLGKVRVDPAIINKPGILTEDEMKKMRSHPYQSYKILSEAGQLTEECRIIAMQHHEREDGNGYPRRLQGDQIHIYGRISSIADVYDALTAERSYKPSLKPFEALRIMKEDMINHFHPQLFEKFVMLFR